MRPFTLGILLAAVSLPARAAPVGPKVKLAILPLSANRVPAPTVAILNELLTAAIDAAKQYEVLSVNDLNAMVGFERLKDVAGCSDVVCGAEIGGALGVELILSGSVSVLGDELIVQLALIDTKVPKVASRGRAVVKNDEKLYRSAVETAAAQVAGVPSSSTAVASPPLAPRPAVPTSPARFAFETQDDDYGFEVTVTSVMGASHRCEPAVRIGAACVLAELPTGSARLSVTSGKLTPFVDSFTVRNKNELYPIQVESRAGDGSVIGWALGGTTVAAGAAMFGTGLGVGNRGLVYGGIPTMLVGAGAIILGFLFERQIDVNYPGIDAFF